MEEILEYAHKTAENVHKATGIDCAVVSSADPSTHSLDNAFCRICREAQLATHTDIACRDAHCFAINQSQRWGGRYEYLCPAGLTYIAASILHAVGNDIVLVAGPFSIMTQEDMQDDMEVFYRGKPPKRIMETPYLSPERVHALGDLIFTGAVYAGSRQNMGMMLKEEAAREHTRLFESIYGMKASAGIEYPIALEKRLLYDINTGDRPAAQKTLNELLGSMFFASGGDFNRIRSRAIELLVLLSRAAIDSGVPPAEILALNEGYLEHVGRFDAIEDLAFWLSGILTTVCSMLFDASEARHSETIRRVVNFVRKNYMKKITLNNISEHVHFSVSYLSKLFKDEMDINLSNYINQVRIEHSKQLLLDRSVQIADIAYMVGFEDQSYFSKVFKKMTGATPGKYREKCGNL